MKTILTVFLRHGVLSKTGETVVCHRHTNRVGERAEGLQPKWKK